MSERQATSRVCAWCEAPFADTVRGGSEKRFCCADHRSAWHKAARLYAIRMEELGIIDLTRWYRDNY